jgi:hypothetical protein
VVTLDQAEETALRWRQLAGLPHTRDHWRWRNGWRPGRRSYWWFVDLDGDAALAGQARDNLDALRLNSLDPARHLHISLQQIGFSDVVPADTPDRLLDHVRQEPLGGPLHLTFGPVDPNPESVVLRVTPWEQLRRQRLALRRVTGQLVGELSGTDDHFWPHVSIGYLNTEIPTAPLLRSLAALGELPHVTVTVRELALVLLNRDNRLWSWETIGSVVLSKP